jgi:hypothetical protein
MRAWIRKHRIGAFCLAVLALAGIGGVLVFMYFTYWFTPGLARAPGALQSSRHGVTAVYVYHRGLRSFTPFIEAGHDGPVYDSRAAGAST